MESGEEWETFSALVSCGGAEPWMPAAPGAPSREADSAVSPEQDVQDSQVAVPSGEAGGHARPLKPQPIAEPSACEVPATDRGKMTAAHPENVPRNDDARDAPRTTWGEKSPARVRAMIRTSRNRPAAKGDAGATPRTIPSRRDHSPTGPCSTTSTESGGGEEGGHSGGAGNTRDPA